MAQFIVFQRSVLPKPEIPIPKCTYPSTNAVLSVYDEAGKLVHRQEGAFAKGVNRFVLERSLVPTTGLLYYTVETSKDSATRKMIQSK